jgi:hypothetical protein
LLALIHIKKTAGKSLKHIMRCELGVGHCDVKRWYRGDDCYSATDLSRLLRVYPWLESIAGHSIHPYSDLRRGFPNLRYYTFVRDPIKRCASEYQYSVLKGRCPPDSFASWIEKPRFRNVQVKSLAGSEDLTQAIALLDEEVAFVGLVERFAESLALMPTILGCPRLRPRRRVNAAPDNRIKDRILNDPGATRALEAANALDRELYDYVARKIFARQQRQARAMTMDAATPLRPQRQFNRRFITNGAYRMAVYRPVVSVYRTLFAEHAR